MIYLDHNASAPMPDRVVDAVAKAARLCGNPSSVHGDGRRARAAIEAARRAVAASVGAAPEQTLFTAGATEANAIALRRCGRNRVLASAVEHPSVLNAVPAVERIRVDGAGIVDLDWLEDALETDGDDTVVSVMLANNETGVCQPLGEIAALTASAGALLHCDAVQGPGRIPVDFGLLGVDLMSLSAHKMGGPKGCGALIMRDAALIAPERGGGQERGLRAGTENVTGIVGFGAAAEIMTEALRQMRAIERLRDALEARVLDLAPDAVVCGGAAPRLPNTACIALPGVASETQVMTLDLAGVAVSAGAACSSGKIAPSHVLRAMGMPDALAGCAIRISLGPGTVAQDIDCFIAAWRDLAGRPHRKAS